MYSNNYCYVYLFLDLTIRAILRIFVMYEKMQSCFDGFCGGGGDVGHGRLRPAGR